MLLSCSGEPSTHRLGPTSFPPGVLNCVPSLGSVGGAALSEHHGVDKVNTVHLAYCTRLVHVSKQLLSVFDFQKIAFTGSTVTGRKILQAAASSNLKKVGAFSLDSNFKGKEQISDIFPFLRWQN